MLRLSVLIGLESIMSLPGLKGRIHAAFFRIIFGISLVNFDLSDAHWEMSETKIVPRLHVFARITKVCSLADQARN